MMTHGENYSNERSIECTKQSNHSFYRRGRTGPDIWAAASRVLDAAGESYNGEKKIVWKEAYGKRLSRKQANGCQETLDIIREHIIAIVL